MVGSKLSSSRAVFVSVLIGAATLVASFFISTYSWSNIGDPAAVLLLFVGSVVAGIEVGRSAPQRMGKIISITGTILFFGLLAVMAYIDITSPRDGSSGSRFDQTMNFVAFVAILGAVPFVLGGMVALVAAILQVKSKTAITRRVAWAALVLLVLGYGGVEAWSRPKARSNSISQACQAAKSVGVVLPAKMAWHVSASSAGRKIRNIVGYGANITVRAESVGNSLHAIAFFTKSTLRDVKCTGDACRAVEVCDFTRNLRLFKSKVGFVDENGCWTATTKIPDGLVEPSSQDCGCVWSDHAKLTVFPDGRVVLALPQKLEL